MLSGDGCSIVVVTELALDVFRDDDTGLRWDVYRQRLEHCGGTPGDWELVSSRADGSSIARDDVDITDPPAVARAGNTIAYTHPATDLLEGDGITTVSLVDLDAADREPGPIATRRGHADHLARHRVRPRRDRSTRDVG